MTNKKELEQMRDEIIDSYLKTLDENIIKSSIDKLTRDAFMYYLNNDDKAYNTCLKTLIELAKAISGHFTNVFSYINYCFLKNMNDILNELLNKDCQLKILFESDLFINVEDHAKLIYTKEYYDFHQKLMNCDEMIKREDEMFERLQIHEKNTKESYCNKCEYKQRCENGKC